MICLIRDPFSIVSDAVRRGDHIWLMSFFIDCLASVHARADPYEFAAPQKIATTTPPLLGLSDLSFPLRRRKAEY